LRGTGITVVFVTHEPDIAAFASRKLTMRDGAIVTDQAQDSAAAIAAAAGAHAATRAATPRIGGAR